MARQTADLSAMVNDVRDLMRQLPDWAGREAVGFYTDSWRRQGYINTGYSKWQARKKTDKKGQSRAILTKTGRLRRSIRDRVAGQKVTIYTDVPYAQVHNEGLAVQAVQTVKTHKRRAHRRKGKKVKETTVQAHTRTINTQMPQRQFMDIPNKPISPFLEKRIVAHVARALDKIFK